MRVLVQTREWGIAAGPWTDGRGSSLIPLGHFEMNQLLRSLRGDFFALQSFRGCLARDGATPHDLDDDEVLCLIGALVQMGRLAMYRQVEEYHGSSAGTGSEPALPPSAPALEPVRSNTTWIEIRVVNEAGDPVSERAYHLELPDGTSRDGMLSRSGIIRADQISSAGACVLSFPMGVGAAGGVALEEGVAGGAGTVNVDGGQERSIEESGRQQSAEEEGTADEAGEQESAQEEGGEEKGAEEESGAEEPGGQGGNEKARPRDEDGDGEGSGAEEGAGSA